MPTFTSLFTSRTLTRATLAGIGAWLIANPTALDFLPKEVGPIILAIAAALASKPSTPAPPA